MAKLNIYHLFAKKVVYALDVEEQKKKKKKKKRKKRKEFLDSTFIC